MELVESQSGPELEPNVPEKFERCDCCGETAVVETLEEENFVYGAGDDEAMLKTVVPVLSCQACGMQWTDFRGAELRTAAVEKHLKIIAGAEPGDVVDASQLHRSAAVLVKANRLWRSQAERARFEIETGLQPIIFGNDAEVEAQHQSGRTVEYHQRFMHWASMQTKQSKEETDE